MGVIASTEDISSERAYNNLHQHLILKNLFARGVLWMLIIDQEHDRVMSSLFQHNPYYFRRFVTVD